MAHQLSLGQRPGRSAGFTLIEMVVVVAVIGVLAAIAYPSYADSVRKGQRASAKERMFDVQQRQAGHYSEKGKYTASFADLGFDSATLTSQSAGHVITIVPGAAGIATGYRILATPVKADPSCSPLSLDHLGAYGPNNC